MDRQVSLFFRVLRENIMIKALNILTYISIGKS